MVSQILALALSNPMGDCKRVSGRLNPKSNSVSGPTVRKILSRNGMSSRYERLLKLEEKARKEKDELTPPQVEAVEKANPCFRERHGENKRPGELICQDTFYEGDLEGVGKVYLQALVDTFGSFAFAYLHTSKLPEHSAVILHNDLLPQYRKWGLEVKAVLTDNGREYRGKDHHPYEYYLALNDVEHRPTKAGRPRRLSSV